jgi:hypothetical protein
MVIEHMECRVYLSAMFTVAPGSPVAVGNTPTSVVVGDFNGDGKPDIAVANAGSNTVSVLLGNGKGGFTPAPGSPIAVGSYPYALAVGRFTADGNLDLVVANSVSNTISVLLGNGKGGFTAAPESPIAVGDDPDSVAVGDFNGDGKLDLAVANGFDNTVSILLGNGNGSFTPAPGSPVTVGSEPSSVAAGDFNKDGKLDLAVANMSDGTISVLLGNGNGTFAPAPGSPAFVGVDPNDVTVGDLNGDGKLDLAVANYAGADVSVLLGNGAGSFTPAPGSPIPVGGGPTSVIIGDFNGDGRPDLAVTNSYESNLTVLLGNGVGGFAPAGGSPIVVGDDPNAVASADFNGDGKPDLAVTNALGNSVSVLLNNSSASTASISGTVYDDANLDGSRETGEAGLAGWQVYADLGDLGYYVPGDPVAYTNASGQYTISGLTPGSYLIREGHNNGWLRTQPAGLYPLGYYDIKTSAGQTLSGFNFGNSVLPPTDVTASTTRTNGVLVSWVAQGGTGVTYLVYRDSQTSPIATNVTSTSFFDVRATPGTLHTYWVAAVMTGQRSPESAPATGRVLTPVSFSLRYGDELVVTASGSDDSVDVAEGGGKLVVTADSEAYSEPAPAAGLFIYTRGGDDSIYIDSSVSVRTTIESIDNAPTTIDSLSSRVIAWIDSTDDFFGLGTVNSVNSFAGGVSKALGASLPNPSDGGPTKNVYASLFGADPVPGDVNQGNAGDCYFLASLAAFAEQRPNALLDSAVDMGDGTYVVEFQTRSGNEFVRVNNDFSIGTRRGGFNFAYPGANNTIWAMVMEKAFCYFRPPPSGTVANSYASIGAGTPSEVYQDLGLGVVPGFPLAGVSESGFFAQVSSALSSGGVVTLSTPQSSIPDLVSDHSYTLISATQNAAGYTTYVVRNPWGFSGKPIENSLGYATLTFQQILNNFVWATVGGVPTTIRHGAGYEAKQRADDSVSS